MPRFVGVDENGIYRERIILTDLLLLQDGKVDIGWRLSVDKKGKLKITGPFRVIPKKKKKKK